ncbi:MAG: biopolymer transporter ExbD [candidate division KSB1 bacterium]|nr:biopolymer transporter ExbD [candidate division KSB1 bacterium]
MLKLNASASPFLVAGGRQKKKPDFSLRLNSLLDMFTILLVFLLKSFSSEGQIVTVSNDLRLPESTSDKAPKVAPIISVTREWIILDDKPLVKIAELDAGGELLIKPLYQGLLQNRAFAEKLGQMDERMGFHGTVDIMGDRDTPFAILKRVMYTCGQVGFNHMLLAVYKQE